MLEIKEIILYIVLPVLTLLILFFLFELRHKFGRHIIKGKTKKEWVSEAIKKGYSKSILINILKKRNVSKKDIIEIEEIYEKKIGKINNFC